MGSATASTHFFSLSKPSNFIIPNSSSLHTLLRPSNLCNFTHLHDNSLHLKATRSNTIRFFTTKLRATLDEKVPDASTQLLQDDDDEAEDPRPNKEVEDSVKVLKDAAKTRKVPAEKVLAALSVMEKAKLDPSGFLETLGGTESPGRTWMLIFTAEKKLTGGRYFPVTAVQRFDAAGKRIENGIFLGSLGSLTFEGRLSWKKRILAFIFERIRIKVGPFNRVELPFGVKDDREPSNKDPFFIWFYIDEEIAVARGRGGGTAFWCRCRRVSNY